MPQLIGQLGEAVESPNYTAPRLPDSALRLIELSLKGNVMFDDLKPMLVRDEAIRTRVLEVAQSARYAARGKIDNVEQAIVRMGLDAVIHIVLEVSMQLRVYRVKGYPMESAQLHRHGIAVAEVATEVARNHGADARAAYLAGLLHDVGFAAGLMLVAPRGNDRPPEIKRVWRAIQAVHERVGEKLADRWSLPDDVAEVIAGHHRDEGRPSKLTAAVMVADALVSDAGVPAPEMGAERPLRRAAHVLGLGADEFDRYRDLARRVAEPHRQASQAAMRQRAG